MKVAFIINGKTKHKLEAVSDIRMHFSNEQAKIFETTHRGHAIELTQLAIEEGFEHIIAVGGDGTLNEVTNGVMLSGKNEDVFMGQLAYGTANDFSKSANFNGKLLDIRNHIFQKRSRKIDLGLAEFTGLDKEPSSRYFINIADIGIGGHVVQKVNSNDKKILGPDLTFLKAIGEVILTYKSSTTTIESKYFNWKGKIFTVAACNGKYFGSGICIAPKAELNNGELALTIIGDITMTDYLSNISALKNGEMILHDQIIYQSVKEVTIAPISDKSPLDIDGEFAGYAPVTMKVIPKAINLIGTE